VHCMHCVCTLCVCAVLCVPVGHNSSKLHLVPLDLEFALLKFFCHGY